MVWGLGTHSGPASQGAAEVKKGKHCVKMAGDGVELGQAGLGAGAQLMGEPVKRKDWGGIFYCVDSPGGRKG